MEDESQTYYCIFCGRGIIGIQQEDGSNTFVHDEVYHPEDFFFDDEETMQ